MRLSFDTKEEAETERDARLRRLHEHGHSSFVLTESERIRFIEARERLAAVGASIEQAVDHFIATKPSLKPPVTLQRLFELCIQEKELLGLRPHSLRQLACSCGSFISGRELRDPSSVTRDEVKAWVLGNNWAPKTQRNYLGDLRTLFSWAKSERYVARNPCSEGEEIKLAAMTEEDVEIFSAAQCERLLIKALLWYGPTWYKHEQKWRDGYRFHSLLGYAILAMTIGVRPEEIVRSRRADIDIEGAAFVVSGRRAKTRGRRVIDLPPMALGWLRLWEGLCPGEWIIPPNFTRLWRALRKEAGLKEWPHDVLRHTAASMHYAINQDENALRAMLGHSKGEDTLFECYRGVRLPSGKPLTRAEAERFYACVRPGMVVQ